RVGIGFPSAVMLVMGGIVGVGIFVNPAVVARGLHSPGLVLAAWALGGGIALLGAFVYAELAARMPTTGGEYVYLRDTYGPLMGFLFGWTTLLVVQAGGDQLPGREDRQRCAGLARAAEGRGHRRAGDLRPFHRPPGVRTGGKG